MNPMPNGAPLPSDEAARLAELRQYALLDSPAEQASDALRRADSQIRPTTISPNSPPSCATPPSP